MTEEIIIDGINVSQCCFYNNGKCDNPNGMACNCINNAVCYFKELKRLEQENKELKEKIKDKPLQCLLYNDKQNKCALFTKTVAYHCALKEIKEIAIRGADGNDCTFCNSIFKKVNEVLNANK